MPRHGPPAGHTSAGARRTTRSPGQPVPPHTVARAHQQALRTVGLRQHRKPTAQVLGVLPVDDRARRHDYHGPGSVLERLTERGGKVLRLGANTDTVTLTHYAEYLADVPNKVRVRRRYVRADTGEVWIESLDDNEGIATWDEGDYFPQIFLDYRASGAVRIGPVGGCEAELLDAAPFVRFAVEWMNRHFSHQRDLAAATASGHGDDDGQ